MNEPPVAVSVSGLREIFDFAGQMIIDQEAYLNSLDAALGDGDHGITMRIGFQAIAKALKELAPTVGLDDVFRTAGMSFMAATGGAIGVIFGKMLMAGAGPLHGAKQLGDAEFRAVLREMELAVARAGKVKVGDKTILDALHAANDAISDEKGTDLRAIVETAAQAAEKGADDTKNFVCRVGRASRLGARTLGCPDPGAVSLSLLLRFTSEWLKRSSTTRT